MKSFIYMVFAFLVICFTPVSMVNANSVNDEVSCDLSSEINILAVDVVLDTNPIIKIGHNKEARTPTLETSKVYHYKNNILLNVDVGKFF